MVASINRARLAGNRLKQETTTLCAQYAVAGLIPKIKTPVLIHVSWFEKDYRRDPDNIRCGLKYILDGLVVSGKLPNDTREWIRGLSDTFPEPDKLNPRVEVRINEIA